MGDKKNMKLQSIKALSILQPWASLIVHGHKKIETRSFQRSYRGPVLIHASAGWSGRQNETCCDYRGTNLFYPALSAIGFTGGKTASKCGLPLGAIIGQVQLESCVQFSRVLTSYCMGEAHWPLTEQEHAFGDYGEGRFGWLLSNPIAFPKPIPCKGNLGLWNPTPEVMAQVEEQIKAAEHGK